MKSEADTPEICVIRWPHGIRLLGMKFDDHFIDQVRNSSSLVHLIGGYLRLKKSGKDYSALCPFHSEKTPSFMVSESKQIFKCFGCGAGGDVFKFIMLMENLSFPEAVRQLAERNGLPLPREIKESPLQGEDRTRLLKIMELATEFFRHCLRHPRTGEEALAYLRQRQIDDATIDGFRIGFAPPGNQLLSSLQKQGYAADQLLACGLIKQGESGQSYDKFRNRIMFPIRDLSGRTIAFGGRLLGEGIPKYLNSPDTVLYNKSSSLYGLDLARQEIRQRDFAVLVEGYFDCVVPFQFGIRNVVASLGTSLTQNQVKILGRYTRNVAVNYDPDSAGVAATLRSIELFLEEGLRVNIVQLPGGEDPDTFVRREGVTAYAQRLQSSLPYLDFALHHFMAGQRNPWSPKGKQEIISSLLPYLRKVTNRIERAEYVSRIASRLQLEEGLIWSEIRKTSRPGELPLRATPAPRADDTTPAERTLLASLLDPDYRELSISLLDEDLFDGMRTAPIFEKAFELRKRKREISVLNLRELLGQDEDLDLLEKVALGGFSPLPLSEEAIRTSVQALREKQLRRISRQIQEQIREEEKQDRDSERLNELLVKKEEIRRKLELDLLK